MAIKDNKKANKKRIQEILDKKEISNYLKSEIQATEGNYRNTVSLSEDFDSYNSNSEVGPSVLR